MIKKAMRGISLLKLLKGETWVSPQSLLHLTEALIRSRLTYGHEAFFTAPDSLWKTLVRTEMAALKICLGVHRHAINDLVYQEAGWLPLKEECRRRCANLQIRARTVPNTVKTALEPDLKPGDKAYRNHLAKKRTSLHQKIVTLSEHTEEVWEKSGTQPNQVVPTQNSPLPPWALDSPDIISTYGKNRSKKTDPLYLVTQAKIQLHEQLARHLHIYTDGSVLENGKTGCAMVIPDLGITKRYKLNKGVSIFTAELYAILMACDTVYNMPQVPGAVAILTDSKSSLQALAAGGRGSRKELQAEILLLAHQIKQKGVHLTLMWLPSHTGIRGNEMADRAAKEATHNGSLTDLGLSPQEVVNKVRNAAYQLRNETMTQKCDQNGWLFLPLQRKKQSLKLPPKNLRLLRRIRTGCHTSVFLNTTCACGSEASLHHALDQCSALASTMTPLWDFRRSHDLRVQDFLQPHPTLGTQPIKILTDSLLLSGADSWF